MVELVFVIVVIGILSAIAVPKFAATRDDAIITKARTTVASVRSALATERQKRILRGDFNTTLSAPTSTDNVFSVNMGSTETKLLEYTVKKCPSSGTKSECWERGTNAGDFIFHALGGTCTFSVSNSRLNKGTCNIPGFEDL